MTLLLFEDELWKNLSPLVYTRPIFDLRCGAFTLRERAVALLATRNVLMVGDERRRRVLESHVASMDVLGICRHHLMPCYGLNGDLSGVLGASTPLVLVNGRALDLNWLPNLLESPIGTVYESHGVLLGARLSPSLASAIMYYLMHQAAADALDELKRFGQVVSINTTMLEYPWELISRAGDQLVHDWPLLSVRLPRYVNQDPHIVVHQAHHVHVADSAQLDGPLVLDARDGPIFIDEDAHIEPFSFIQGPAYIGSKALVSSARIRPETSIGPVCRVGGEIEASTMQGYSNKHHDGFLGHSWLGEWVNVGAMTTNSDLKNTYGTVRVPIDGLGQLNSGVLKLGCFLADHVKLGIGLHLNGGSMIGIGSNIFGVHMVPKAVPPFTWGGDVFREYRLENMIDVARRVMKRRKHVLSDEYEQMLRSVFAMTRASRGYLNGETYLPQTNVTPTEQLALSHAETEAVRAFELAR